MDVYVVIVVTRNLGRSVLQSSLVAFVATLRGRPGQITGSIIVIFKIDIFKNYK